jgi:hypothetical protein
LKTGKLLSLSLFFLSLLSCHTTGLVGESSNPVYLTDDNKVALLPVSLYRENREILQLLEGNYDGTEYLMQTILILNSEEISISAFSTMGNSVYDLQYRNGEAVYEAIVDVPGTSALYMLADIQFCYYPEDAVEKMIETSGLEFETVNYEEGWTRTILNKDEPIIIIKRNGGILEYENRLRRYSYRIEEL